jgi:hypothetical protein
MDPLAFYQLADWLIATRRGPDGFRTSASRAYYGAFHTALRFLAEMGLHIPNTDNKHEKLPMILDGAEDQAMEEAAQRLRTLRENRNRADYQLDKAEFEKEEFAQVQLMDAGKVIGAIGSCRVTRDSAESRYDKVKEALTREFRRLCLGIR